MNLTNNLFNITVVTPSFSVIIGRLGQDALTQIRDEESHDPKAGAMIETESNDGTTRQHFMVKCF